MIEKKSEPRYYVGDREYKSLREAQGAELVQILNDLRPNDLCPNPTTAEIADHLLANSERVTDILTTTEASLPKARKIHGGRKPRKGKQAEMVSPIRPEAA
jgi:hypothetical protein